MTLEEFLAEANKRLLEHAQRRPADDPWRQKVEAHHRELGDSTDQLHRRWREDNTDS